MHTDETTSLIHRQIGAAVAFQRILKGKSQRELARAIGVTERSLAKMEGGKVPLRAHDLLGISFELGCRSKVFFAGVNGHMETAAD